MVKVNDRIELVHTDDKFTNLKPGDKGTVNGINSLPGLTQIWVSWDSGSSLALIEGTDRYKIVRGN